jgi:excisionase family DNA binding protein
MQLAIGNYISVNETADLLGLTTGRIRQLLIAKELHGLKVNERAWVLDRKEVEKYARKTGRELMPAAG